jgi:hypothetical protein
VPEKMIGTLTSSILKSVHTSISPIFSYKLCSMATPGHPEPFPLENHGRIVALTPDLQRVSFYSVTDFLHHSSTTELILSLILIKGSYPSSKASLRCRESSSACSCCGVQIHIRSPRGSIPLSKRLTIFGLERNDPARPIIFNLLS